MLSVFHSNVVLNSWKCVYEVFPLTALRTELMNFFVSYSWPFPPFLFRLGDFTFPLSGDKYNMRLVAGETGVVSVHSNRKVRDVVASFGNIKLVPYLFKIRAEFLITDFCRISRDRK